MASGPSYMFLSILMLITVKGGVASSQFQSDFGLCIVDTQLIPMTVMRGGAFRAERNPVLTFATSPVIERGTAATYDRQMGKIKISDDGTYLFIIHRVGVSITNAPLLLQFNNSTDEYVTLVEIMDNGDGSSFSTHVLAELKRGNKVFINHRSEEVIGDEDNPFIYSSFLLYHNPITSFPKARQSAFSVPALANLSIADAIIDDFDLPTVNIGDGFDSLTGIFTAPFGGLYVFHLGVTFILQHDGPLTGRALLALTVNGDTIAQVNGFFPVVPDMLFRYAPVAPPPNNAVTVAQELNQGDTVSLKNIISTEDIEGKVMFVGYLLS